VKIEKDNTEVSIEGMVVGIEGTEDSYRKIFSYLVTKLGFETEVAKFYKA